VNGQVCDFEQIRDLDFSSGIVLLDGAKVNSYDELVQLASSDKYKDLESIEIVLLPAVSGG
jgi:hypothetical protein